MEILSLGEKIRNRRRELDMTLKDLAGDRVTAGQLSFVELGKSNPSAELLKYIAERLQVDLDYLLESESAQARKICEYDIKMAQAYIYDKKYEDANELLDKSYDMAKRYGLENMLGMIELNKGRIALDGNEYEKAAEYFLNANVYFIENHCFSGEIDAYMLMGETAYKRGVYELSLGYFNQAKALYGMSGFCDDNLKAEICFKICLCCINLNRLDEADEHLKCVEYYLNSINDKSEYAHKLMSVSLTYRDSRNYEMALHYADSALDFFREIDDMECLTKMKMDIGFIYSDKGDLDKSDYYLEDCKKNMSIRNVIDAAKIYLKLAYNDIRRNRFDKVKEHIKKSFELFVEDDDIDGQIECYSLLSDMYILKKEYSNCEEALNAGLSLLKSIDKPFKLMKYYIKIGKYYGLMGDKQRQMEYMDKAYSMLSNMNLEIKSYKTTGHMANLSDF